MKINMKFIITVLLAASAVISTSALALANDETSTVVEEAELSHKRYLMLAGLQQWKCNSMLSACQSVVTKKGPVPYAEWKEQLKAKNDNSQQRLLDENNQFKQKVVAIIEKVEKLDNKEQLVHLENLSQKRAIDIAKLKSTGLSLQNSLKSSLPNIDFAPAAASTLTFVKDTREVLDSSFEDTGEVLEDILVALIERDQNSRQLQEDEYDNYYGTLVAYALGLLLVVLLLVIIICIPLFLLCILVIALTPPSQKSRLASCQEEVMHCELQRFSLEAFPKMIAIASAGDIAEASP